MLKVFKDNYNRSEFYALAGKFFAESAYKKQLQYLSNKDETVWCFNIDDNGEVLAFNSYELKGSRIEFKATFFEHNINDLSPILNKQIEELNSFIIETAHSNKLVIDLFKNLGFKEYKKTTNYTFLVKEI